MNTLFKLHLDNLARTKQPVNLVRNDSEATLYIYDVISADWGVSALSVIDAIAQAGDTKTLNVRISSPGGDVFESRAIMAAIARFPGSTTAYIDGVCASAATSIALACGEVVMSDGGFFMIHNASGMAWGDKQALRDTADLLEKVEGVIIADYTGKTGKDAAEITAMMDAETWMTAEQALEHGFIDRITSGKAKPGNTWNLAAFAKAPRPVRCESSDDAGISGEDAKFLRDMIPHHEMAIEMARTALPTAGDEVRELAQGIIASQAGEIALMQTWLDSPADSAGNKKSKPMKMQDNSPPDPAKETPAEPAPAAGFFMSDANANRLRLTLI